MVPRVFLAEVGAAVVPRVFLAEVGAAVGGTTPSSPPAKVEAPIDNQTRKREALVMVETAAAVMIPRLGQRKLVGGIEGIKSFGRVAQTFSQEQA